MLPLFLVKQLTKSGFVEIIDEEAQHAISAMRIGVSEQISLTDGAGARAVARVVEVKKKKLLVEIQSYEFEEQPTLKLAVAQALTKSDRAREAVELLTQAGVNKILPWKAQRSVGNWKEDALQKWHSWAREATKQSRRSWFPEVSAAVSTAELVAEFENFDLILIFQEGAKSKLSSVLENKSPKSILMIIGPEGGITDDESELLNSAGAISVVMGKPVFRSAHAGAAALAGVQTALGIW